MKFNEFIYLHKEELQSLMSWENYELNDINLIVTEMVKDHALEVLANNYSRFEVEDDILNEIKADIFIGFPPLLQQLSISRIMSSETVPEIDILSETMTRTESGIRDSVQDNDTTLGTQVLESNSIENESITTGNNTENTFSNVDQEISNIQVGEVNITNTSGIEMTGSRNVNLSHSLPEQAIDGETGKFPVDSQGTPELKDSYVQGANESFSTVNPIDSSETSNQNNTLSNNTESETSTNSNTTQTENSKVEDVGNSTRTLTNSGTDRNKITALENMDNEVTESREREVTNAQYAYEINAFLQSVQSINAFQNWVDRFSWVCGII